MKTIETLVETYKEWGSMPGGTLLRVDDNAAKRFVADKVAKYVPKSEWKKLRDESDNDKHK